MWLWKKIPNYWIDKDTLWEICILEGIKHYVEKDGGLGFDYNWRESYRRNQSDPNYPGWQKKFDRDVFKNYTLITEYLVGLENNLKEAWNKIPEYKFLIDEKYPQMSKEEYESKYGEINRLESEIENLKTKIMIWAVKNRKKIWR
jgi:hypothetical protein